MESSLRNTPFGKVHVWCGGNPQNPALLLLHAGLADAEFSWSPIWDELSRRYYVIAPDLPGFGLSPPIHRPTTSIFAQVLQDLLIQFKIHQTIVVGNSLGASIAYEFAAQFPHLTSKLVLVNGCKLSRAPALARLFLEQPSLHAMFVKLGYQKFFGDSALKREFAHLNILSPEKIRNLQENGMKLSEIGGDLWLYSNPSEQPLEVPVSVLWGDEDETLPLKKGEALSRELRASFHPIVGTAHMPQIENPKQFISTLNRELQ